MTKGFVLAAISSLAATGAVRAAMIVDFGTGHLSDGNSATSTAPNVTAGTLTIPGGTDGETAGQHANLENGIKNFSHSGNGRDIEFSLMVAAGFQLSIHDITFVTKSFSPGLTVTFTDSAGSTSLGMTQFTDSGSTTLKIDAPETTILPAGTYTVDANIYSSTAGGSYLGFTDITVNGGITAAADAATPEPASLGLVAVGAIGMLARRHRTA